MHIECEPQQVTFQVKDQGIGIPLEEKQLLFQSFYRATNVGSISGSGLGLHITKKFVELHQGSITFKSEVNKGSIFRVNLPQIMIQN